MPKKERNIGDFGFCEIQTPHGVRVKANVVLPLDIAGSQQFTHFWWPKRGTTKEQARQEARKILQAQYDALNGLTGSPALDLTGQAHGLFAHLIFRLKQQKNLYHGKSNRKWTPDHYNTIARQMTQLMAFWLDQSKGWTAGRKPASQQAYIKPRSGMDADQRLDFMLAKIGKLDPDPKAFTVDHAKDFLQWLYACGYAPDSINTCMNIVSSRFKDLKRVQNGSGRLLDFNPMAKDEDENLRPALAEKDEETMDYEDSKEDLIFAVLHGETPLHELPNWTLGRRVSPALQGETALFCELSIRTGQRRITIYRDLDLSGYDAENRVLSIRRQADELDAPGARKNPKGRKGGAKVHLPVDEDLARCLEAFRARGGKWSVTPGYFSRIMRAVITSLGLDIEKQLHGFRATVFTRAASGAGQEFAKRLCGHSLRGVASSYWNLKDKRLRARIDEIISGMNLHALPTVPAWERGASARASGTVGGADAVLGNESR